MSAYLLRMPVDPGAGLMFAALFLDTLIGLMSLLAWLKVLAECHGFGSVQQPAPARPSPRGVARPADPEARDGVLDPG